MMASPGKRLLSILLAVRLLVCPLPQAGAASLVMGDVNSDTRIDASDGIRPLCSIPSDSALCPPRKNPWPTSMLTARSMRRTHC